MNREKALALLAENIKNPNLIKHCLATEAVMKVLAEHFSENTEKWSIAGLLHDLDAEVTQNDPALHGKTTIRILSEKGIDPEITETILMHNEKAAKKKRSSLFEHALAAGETITGLITATALVYPDKKIASVKPKSIKKRMKEKAFAASVNRETILEIEKTGLDLDSFIEISLNAMKAIADDLEL